MIIWWCHLLIYSIPISIFFIYPTIYIGLFDLQTLVWIILAVLLSIFHTLIMPGEVIKEPNPQPQPSHLPDYLENLSVKVDREILDQKSCDALLKFRRAASYIAA